jgi:spore coat polysaccharide biosynthesis predicted glycosyltransferase SpsG
MKKILFRCDASRDIGVGHVTRSFALAEIFALNGWEVTFLGNLDEPIWMNILLKKIKNIKLINTLAGFNTNRLYDVIVFDSYELQDLEIKILTQISKIKVYIVDDISPVISSDLYVSTLPIEFLPKFNNVKKYLFGPKYALIRQEINEINKKINYELGVSDVTTLALFSGGSSKNDFIKIILSQMLNQAKRFNIKVFADYIKLVDSIDESFEIKFISHHPDFFKELTNIDLVIAPASVSSWEFIRMKVPLAVYGIYENQVSTYNYIVGQGLAHGLGMTKNYEDFELNEDIFAKALRGTPTLDYLGSPQNRNVVDGNGPKRIFEEIVKMI